MVGEAAASPLFRQNFLAGLGVKSLLDFFLKALSHRYTIFKDHVSLGDCILFDFLRKDLIPRIWFSMFNTQVCMSYAHKLFNLERGT